MGCSLYLTHHAERRGPVLRSQPVNSAVPRQCSAKRFTVVLWRVLSRVWTCLWTRARYPSSSFTNSVLSSRHLSRFSDTFHLSRPTTACCAWIDDLLTLVWQMLSPIINVASLGAMIHDAVGISRRECSSEGPRWAYFICGLILCAPPRNHLISCPASRAHARSSCHEILQLKMHLRSLHGRLTTRNRETRVFHGFHFSFINKKITIAWLNNISKTSGLSEEIFGSQLYSDDSLYEETYGEFSRLFRSKWNVRVSVRRIPSVPELIESELTMWDTGQHSASCHSSRPLLSPTR